MGRGVIELPLEEVALFIGDISHREQWDRNLVVGVALHITVADLEIWKGGCKVVGVAQKAAEGGRQRRITRAAQQPKYGLKM